MNGEHRVGFSLAILGVSAGVAGWGATMSGIESPIIGQAMMILGVAGFLVGIIHLKPWRRRLWRVMFPRIDLSRAGDAGSRIVRKSSRSLIEASYRTEGVGPAFDGIQARYQIVTVRAKGTLQPAQLRIRFSGKAIMPISYTVIDRDDQEVETTYYPYRGPGGAEGLQRFPLMTAGQHAYFHRAEPAIEPGMKLQLKVMTAIGARPVSVEVVKRIPRIHPQEHWGKGTSDIPKYMLEPDQPDSKA